VLFELDIREEYIKKVKSIYGQIISYATKAQSELDLNESQNYQISSIKVANRKMVEIIKDVNELSRNITLYLNSENKYIQKEYDKLRKRVAKVLRIIHLFRTEKDKELYYKTLKKLEEEARSNKTKDNLGLDAVIRKDLITVDMASSLVNDTDNVNDIIKNLISVAALLYGKKDTLLENGNG
jgi:phosphate:Na+ symporter